MLRVCAAVSCGLALAACRGVGNAGSAQTGASVSRALVRYSACMRSHGVSGFPDPSTGQGPNAVGIDGYDFNLPAGLNPRSPAFEQAEKSCQPG